MVETVKYEFFNHYFHKTINKIPVLLNLLEGGAPMGFCGDGPSGCMVALRPIGSAVGGSIYKRMLETEIPEIFGFLLLSN